MTFNDYIHNVKTYVTFNKKEVQNLIISILIVSFIVGFDDGNVGGTWVMWFVNLINSILIVTLAFLVRLSVQKLACMNWGYTSTYKIWWYGLIFSIIITFVSRGKLWLVIPGSVLFDIIQKARIGKFRYGLNYEAMGYFAMLGSLANIFLALGFKLIMNIPGLESNPLLQKAMLINIAFAIGMMLPIPGLDGVTSLYGSRITYITVMVSLIIAAITMLILSLKWVIAITLVMAVVTWLTYYLKFEREHGLD